MKTNYSDFTKKNILKCFDKMLKCVERQNIQNEDVYSKMRITLKKRQVALPKDVYKKMNDFADENLKPIIFDRDYWKVLDKEEWGFYDENGVYHLKNTEARVEHCKMFEKMIFDIQNKVTEFGMKELYPILVEEK